MGNPQLKIRIPPEWGERLSDAAEDADVAGMTKAMLKVLADGMIELDRDDAGRVVGITGRDADGKRVTIRTDGKPVVRGTRPVAEAPRRGRPRKADSDV